MQWDGLYEPPVLKKYISYYCSGLIRALKQNKTLVINSFHNNLQGYEEFKDHRLGPETMSIQKDTN